MLLIGLFSLSIGCSFYGSKKLIRKYSAQFEAPPRPEIINSLEHRITDLETQIKSAGQNKYRDGRITIESRETILLLTSQIGTLEKEKMAYEKTHFEEVNLAKSYYRSKVEGKAFYFALATLFFEICFMICVWYLEYFDWRSWSEFQTVNNLCTDDVQLVHSANSKEYSLKRVKNDIQNHDVKYLKSRIATAKYRLKNGIGNEETNRRNLEKFEQILEGIKGV